MPITFTLGNVAYSDDMLAGYGYQDALPRMFASFAGDLSQFSTQYAAFQSAVLSGPVSAVSGMAGAVALANPNQRLVNPDFRIAQRATTGSVTTTGTIFVADRWAAYAGGITGTMTVTQAAAADFVLGENISAYLELNIPAGGGNVFIYQRIEDAHTLGGLRGTVNILVWSQFATSIDRITVDRNFGTGGSAADVLGRVNNVAVSAGWNKLQITFAAPDSSGKTFGPNSFITVSIQPRLATTTDAKVLRFARVWLDDNNGAQSPTGGRFGERPLQIEQALSERYYERIGVDYSAYASAAGQQIVLPVAFGNRKAKSPALTFAAAGTLTNCTAALAASSDPTGGAKLTLTATAAGLVSIAGAIVAADAEL